jgi:magnesium-transporting ATPase (P-type)
VNNRTFRVYRKGEWKDIKAMNIVVGDLIRIEQDQVNISLTIVHSIICFSLLSSSLH